MAMLIYTKNRDTLKQEYPRMYTILPHIAECCKDSRYVKELKERCVEQDKDLIIYDELVENVYA